MLVAFEDHGETVPRRGTTSSCSNVPLVSVFSSLRQSNARNNFNSAAEGRPLSAIKYK